MIKIFSKQTNKAARPIPRAKSALGQSRIQRPANSLHLSPFRGFISQTPKIILSSRTPSFSHASSIKSQPLSFGISKNIHTMKLATKKSPALAFGLSKKLNALQMNAIPSFASQRLPISHLFKSTSVWQPKKTFSLPISLEMNHSFKSFPKRQLCTEAPDNIELEGTAKLKSLVTQERYQEANYYFQSMSNANSADYYQKLKILANTTPTDYQAYETVFEEMTKNGIQANPFHFKIILRAFKISGENKLALPLFEKFQQLYPFMGNRFIDAAASVCNMTLSCCNFLVPEGIQYVEKAKEILQWARENGIASDNSLLHYMTLNIHLTHVTNGGRIPNPKAYGREVFQIWKQIGEDGLEYETRTHVKTIKMLSKLKLRDETMEVWEAFRSNPLFTVDEVYNSRAPLDMDKFFHSDLQKLLDFYDTITTKLQENNILVPPRVYSHFIRSISFNEDASPQTLENFVDTFCTNDKFAPPTPSTLLTLSGIEKRYSEAGKTEHVEMIQKLQKKVANYIEKRE